MGFPTDKEHIAIFDFCCDPQLITAFEKAMILMEPVPGEEHKKLSSDYVNYLSKVSVSSLPILFHHPINLKILSCHIQQNRPPHYFLSQVL